MGLAERRRLKQLREEIQPKRQQELQAATGSAVTLEVDWDSVGEETNALTRIDEYGFMRLIDAFKLICRDGLGREAVAEKIKAVRLINSTNSSWSTTCQIKEGVVTIDWDWGNVLIVTPELIAESLDPQL
jgi:hypothetical protein